MWQRGASAMTNSSPTVNAYRTRARSSRSPRAVSTAALACPSTHVFALALRSVPNALFTTLTDV